MGFLKADGVSSVATEDISSVATEDISSVSTEDISSVATEEPPAVFWIQHIIPFSPKASRAVPRLPPAFLLVPKNDTLSLRFPTQKTRPGKNTRGAMLEGPPGVAPNALWPPWALRLTRFGPLGVAPNAFATLGRCA